VTESSVPPAVPRPPVQRAPSAGPAAPRPGEPPAAGAPEPAADLGPEVAGALDALDHLDRAPLAEHVEAFDTVHRLLQSRLAEAED